MGKIQVRPLRWWAESAPPGWDRVKVSENLGATAVAPVAPADTSLQEDVVIHLLATQSHFLQVEATVVVHLKATLSIRASLGVRAAFKTFFYMKILLCLARSFQKKTRNRDIQRLDFGTDP